MRDLLRRQPAEGAQSERDLSVERKRGMAAREHELQPLVGNRRLVHDVLRCLRYLEQARLRRKRAIAPDAVDRTIPRGGDEPRARVGRCPVTRPALGGDRERFLRGFLGEVEVAEEADQGSEDASPLVAEDLFENR
jgi:hypothetical protein